MTREDYKKFAAGKYALKNIEGTIDTRELLIYIDAAVDAWDFFNTPVKREQDDLVIKKAQEYDNL